MLQTSRADATQADAYVDWINAFENISHRVHHISDLSDGIILFEVLADIDPKWFKSIRSADVGENWVLKFNNLKKLHKLVSRYYEEVMGRDIENLLPINLNSIAKEEDVRETIKLCQLIICIAVQCHKNQIYIGKIQSLSQQSQHALMLSIEEVIGIISGNLAEPDNGSVGGVARTGGAARTGYNDDAGVRPSAELAKILDEKADLEAQHKQLIEEHAQLRHRYDELEAEKEDLQLRLREMDKAVEQANETGRADFIMRTEIEHLKQDLLRSEDRRQEVEMLLDTQTQTIEDLKRKKEELTKQVEQAARLNDQLDEYRHAAEKLQKAENVIEKYKKKLEESADMRRQLKVLEEQNLSLMDRNQQIEDEYRKVLAFKTLMDSYKEQIAQLETKNNEILREKNKLEYEIRQMTRKMEILEAERMRDLDRIQALEENLQEVELGGTMDQVIAKKDATGIDDDMELDDEPLKDSLEDSLKESNVTELKLSKRRLERQIKTLQQENAAGGSQKAVVLQHLLDDANRLKAQFEKSYLEAAQERDILQSDMARIREGIPDALVDQSQHTLSLRLHIIDLEKESKALRDELEKLQSKVADGKVGFGNDVAGGEFMQKYKEMEERSKQLEEQTKRQLQDINKLLLEKDMLQSQSIETKDLLLEKERLNSEMKASLAVFEAKDDEPLKQQNAHLQQQTIQQQEQLHELQVKLKKAKEFIKQQDKLLKDRFAAGNAGNYDEAVSSLKAELALKDEENERLKKQIHELRLQARREQQLMMSAWCDLARRTHKELVNSKTPNPNSWLGQQRRILDSQLRRR